MKIVLQPSVFQDKKVLSVDALNKALYDSAPSTLPAAVEHGLYSVGNGGFDGKNLDPDFQLRREHLQPGQARRVRATGGWETLDNMSDVSGRALSKQPQVIAKTQAMPGCAVRVYVPFAARALKWNISWFWSVARWWGLDVTADDVTDQARAISTHLFLNGRHLIAYKRQYPLTWFGSRAGPQSRTTYTGNDIKSYLTEAEQASHINLSHLQTEATATNPRARLEPGFHEVFIGFYVQPVRVAIEDDLTIATDNSTAVNSTIDVSQRLSLGCRAAVVAAVR